MWMDEDFKKTFLSCSKLDHKNVMKFYGGVLQHVSAGMKFIFVMERCAESLREYFKKHKDLSPARAPKSSRKVAVLKILNLAHDIASGLASLKDEGIVHRDLKPENILVRAILIFKIIENINATI